MIEHSRRRCRASKWLAVLQVLGFVACARPEAPPVDKPPERPAEQPLEPSSGGQTVAMGSQAQPPAAVQNSVETFLDPVGMPMSPGMIIADRWLRALRDGDEAALTNATRYPFEWRSTGELDCPAKQPAATPEELSPIVSCLLDAAPLPRALTEHERAGIVELPVGRLQAWARPWRQDVRPGATLVNAFVQRIDLQLDMDLWVVDGAVQAFWMHAVDRASEVAVVKRWLEALKNRDARSLSEATSYPFEVRDAGREAKCGRRTAAASGALQSAIKCMFENEELHHALTSNRPFIESTAEDYEVPDWAQRWFQPSRHSSLKTVSAGAHARPGFSFDMVVLVDSVGVRALWMYGSLESTD